MILFSEYRIRQFYLQTTNLQTEKAFGSAKVNLLSFCLEIAHNITLYNVCLVHRGMFSTPGRCSVHQGVFSTSGGVQSIRGYHEYIGEYLEYIMIHVGGGGGGGQVDKSP